MNRQLVVERLDGQRKQRMINDDIVDLGSAWSSEKTNEILQITNRLYEGKNLEVHFAEEIAAFGGNVWAWIQARIQNGKFTGINVGDFIPFTADGNTVLAEVAGINTYRNFGDIVVPNHIDFISRDCWPETRQWNRVNYNNGIAAMTTPFLASDIWHWLNGLAGQVPNDATVTMTQNPTPAASLVAVDYTVTGLLPRLPAALRAVIIQKRELMPRRFSAGILLTNSNSWDWRDGGFLWLPSEFEVYGAGVWGDVDSPNQGNDKFGAVQYPLFATNIPKRSKGAGHGGARTNWSLSSPRGGSSTVVTRVSHAGNACSRLASQADRVPVCFRIA